MKQETSIGAWPTPERVVRVTLPTAIANDLKAFQSTQASILDRLGCPACCSGFDIRFDITRSFSIDDKLNIHEVFGSGDISFR
ncbi:MAG: hypothetical protein GKR91_08555 [Pseudomonadales bacterium]|nr:hypothetical protein [Pseudomonadales bacterium]